MFLFRQRLFLVGHPSEQKKRGAVVFSFSVHMDACPHAVVEKDVFSGGWNSFSSCPGKNRPKPNVEIIAALPRITNPQPDAGSAEECDSSIFDPTPTSGFSNADLRNLAPPRGAGFRKSALGQFDGYQVQQHILKAKRELAKTKLVCHAFADIEAHPPASPF